MKSSAYRKPLDLERSGLSDFRRTVAKGGVIMSWFLLCLNKYADFSGRARRKEYWFFILFLWLTIFGLSIIGGILGAVAEIAGPIFSGLAVLAMLGAFIPTLAVAVRRLHDTGKSGGWIFINLVPLVGGLWFLFLMVSQGTSGSNDYGDDPLLLE